MEILGTPKSVSFDLTGWTSQSVQALVDFADRLTEKNKLAIGKYPDNWESREQDLRLWSRAWVQDVEFFIARNPDLPTKLKNLLVDAGRIKIAEWDKDLGREIWVYPTLAIWTKEYNEDIFEMTPQTFAEFMANLSNGHKSQILGLGELFSRLLVESMKQGTLGI